MATAKKFVNLAVTCATGRAKVGDFCPFLFAFQATCSDWQVAEFFDDPRPFGALNQAGSERAKLGAQRLFWLMVYG
jgi:hypothetical protein